MGILIKQTKELTLNNAEQWLARELATRRLAQNNKDGAEATYYNPKMSPLEHQINYVGSEFAFCKWHNIWPDINWTDRMPFDCIYQGYKVDVKWTHLEYGHLLAKVKERPEPPDFFVLMIGLFPSYEYAGRMPAHELLQHKRITYKLGKTVLDHPAYAAKQSELNK